MPKLHELLAAERQVVSQLEKLNADTLNKFGKPHFFQGYTKTLKMIEDDPTNDAVEASAAEKREVVTTVKDTLDYWKDFWIRAEALLADKNRANQNARGVITLEGGLTFGPSEGLPVDELMGLEKRLADLRTMLAAMPTLDATKKWVEAPNVGENILQTEMPEVTTKTKKVKVPFTLAPATDKHPAQVQALDEEKTVGTFTMTKFSGEASAVKKAATLERIDEMIAAVKQARVRANGIEVETTSRPHMVKLLNWLLAPVLG